MFQGKVDRRDHLRIADSMYIEYRRAGRGEVFADEAAPAFEVSQRFRLLRDLYQIELEAAQVLRGLTEAQPRLGSFLHTVNRRLEILATVICADELAPDARLAQDVSLCEEGLSFRVPEVLQEGTLLGLKLLFHPTMLGLTFFGEVRYSRLAADRDQYVAGVRLLHRDPTARELLTRHIVRRQSAERRERLLRDGYSESPS